jgi:hypothetical protein
MLAFEEFKRSSPVGASSFSSPTPPVLVVDVHLPGSLFLAAAAAARLLRPRPLPLPDPATEEGHNGGSWFPLSIPAEAEVAAASPEPVREEGGMGQR